MLFLASIFFISCTQADTSPNEDDVCVGDNYPITLDKYIKKIKRTPINNESASRTSEFTYNEFNLLAKEREFTTAYNIEYLFEYQCNNNVSKMFNATYTYNSDGKIIYVETEGGSYSYDLIYNGQIILAKGKFVSLSKEITLELNSENLIHKMSRIDSYATFDYDLNGNVTKVKDYDLNDALLNEYEIKYDQNPNPFYGQLKSTYLVGFIELFNLSSHLGLSYIRTYGFNSFYFPYFKNNIISIEEITSTAPYKFLIENEFIYDSQNYPIIIESTLESSPNINYEIEYN